MTDDVPRLRLMMTWMPFAGTEELDTALLWQEALSGGSLGAPLCLWSPTPPDHPVMESACWHQLALPSRIDRYVRGPVATGDWNPWGNKSGPNFQFFMQLDEMRLRHDDEWVLQIEGDTFPMGASVEEAVLRLLTEHSTSWIIGAVNHPIVLPALNPRLHGHINGAALYRLDSEEFRAFRRRVWIPSLIEAVEDDPAIAYDCLSAPALHDTLPEALRAAWTGSAARFTRTYGMVNASTYTARSLEDERLRSTSIDEGLADEGAEIWFLHTKRAASPATRTRLWRRP